MNLAIDYDDTYTKDPEFWNVVIKIAQFRGHTVFIVTARHYGESEEYGSEVITHMFPMGVEVIYTARRAKRKFLQDQHGVNIDVWIDDAPEYINIDRGKVLHFG